MIWATVITDASFCDKTKKAGWAAWIRIDGIDAPIKRYGSFKGKVKTSTEAEKLAAANGLFIAQSMGADAFLLQTDCMAVVHLVTGFTKQQGLRDEWKRTMAKCGVLGKPLQAKHVKGHTSTKDARSYVNRWCDEMANKARRQS
jgi:ribonuclease HI